MVICLGEGEGKVGGGGEPTSRPSRCVKWNATFHELKVHHLLRVTSFFKRKRRIQYIFSIFYILLSIQVSSNLFYTGVGESNIRRYLKCMIHRIIFRIENTTISIRKISFFLRNRIFIEILTNFGEFWHENPMQ